MDITFKGISSDSLGFVIEHADPAAATQLEYDNIQIPGRPENLYSAKKTRRNYTRVFSGNIIEMGKLREIYAAYQGYGNLICSDEPDKYYKAAVQIITPERIVLDYHKLDLAFDCQPYAYALNNEPVTVRSSGGIVVVDGTEYCEPVYKIYGEGNITLKVNNVDASKALKLYDVSGYVTVDSSALICHKNGNLVRNYGQLPYMSPGENLVEWAGTVSKIEITKNERWI